MQGGRGILCNSFLEDSNRLRCLTLVVGLLHTRTQAFGNYIAISVSSGLTIPDRGDTTNKTAGSKDGRHLKNTRGKALAVAPTRPPSNHFKEEDRDD